MIHPIDSLAHYGSVKTKPKMKHLATHGALHIHGFGFLGDNHYIRSGYRLHYSTTDCLHSLFELHNETWNVWIHIVGSLVFATLLAIEMFAMPDVDTTFAVARWPLWLFLGNVSICFALSATYHLMYTQHAAADSFYLRFDFGGILFLIFGAAVPMLYYTFFCSPPLRTFYVGLASAVGCASFVATFLPAFTTSPSLRIAVFGSTILSLCIIPLTHLLVQAGMSSPEIAIMLQPVVKCMVFNIPGVVFYATKVPERWRPGVFDVVGSSHQWWHLCVVLASAVYYWEIQSQYNWRHATGCPV
ncbi:Aste57867_12395 [Aphanomyces stellatus]|uniref:Aste57867_12395 protein n=1 Tax=Aphanomyces stellatus TaxID=120398 RepID=A0A485KVV1_9STRA|nr:hypothetical protein As57867_012349 [Aphanomyces stellatus]VFT89246.1 Aste57867_12395 [Aphanomyces stellatus]